jgi:hypothetical protein
VKNALDATTQISGFVKLKITHCARPGDRAGLCFSHWGSIAIGPESFVQPRGRCMAAARSSRPFIVSGLYFQCIEVRSHAFLPGSWRLESIALHKGHLFFSCCLQG